MELKQYLQMVRRWLWLLILGIVLGGGAGYYFSDLQEPVYQASTRALVMRPPLEQSSDLTYYSDLQLVQTYIQLLSTQPVLDAASERLGYQVNKGQIKVQQNQETQIIQVTVEDQTPNQAADIANILVEVLIEQNESIQTGRYASTEDSIQAQIEQVETRVTSLQDEVDKLSTQDFQQQISEVQAQIQPLEDEVSALQKEIAALSLSTEPEDRTQVAVKQARIDQIQPLLNLYQQIYSNLVVLGKPVEAGAGINSRLAQLQSTLDLYQNLYINLLSSLETIRLAQLQNTPNIVQIEPAIVPRSPIRPRPLMNTALAAVVGLMLAAGIVFLSEYLDDTLKTPEDVERVLGLPVVGLVAQMRYKKKGVGEIYVTQQPRSPISEGFRSLRTNLEFAAVERPIKTLLVTSPGPGEGKTTIAANLAAIFSQADKRVALIDADMRRPGVHCLFGISNREGLGNVFLNRVRPNMVSRRKDELPNLSVITSGSLPPNPAELLGSEKMDQILEELCTYMDLVVIDTPPTIVADATILSAKVDAVLFVIQPGTTHAQDARASFDMFKRAGARVIGVVMNRIPRSRSYYYGGYELYSPYGESKTYFAQEEETAKQVAQKQAEAPLLASLPASAKPGQISTVEAPRSTSYLGSLFEQLNELPPADPKQNGSKP